MEWCTVVSGKYRIECLSAATFPGALKVIRESFFRDEPVSIGAEVNKNPLAIEELLELCADAALDGVSLVAVAKDTGEVVAVAFNKLQVPTSSSSERPFFEIFAEERCKQASSRSLVQFMANVDGRCNIFENYNADCGLEIMFLATLREHRHQRLGTTLFQVSFELAKKLKEGPVAKITPQDLGPKYSHMKAREVSKIPSPKICQSICTSTGTQKIARSLDYTILLKVSFDEFVHDGKTYAERLQNDPSYCEIIAKVVQ